MRYSNRKQFFFNDDNKRLRNINMNTEFQLNWNRVQSPSFADKLLLSSVLEQRRRKTNSSVFKPKKEWKKLYLLRPTYVIRYVIQFFVYCARAVWLEHRQKYYLSLSLSLSSFLFSKRLDIIVPRIFPSAFI